MPPALELIINRVQVLLALLATLLPAVALQAAMLLPLLRACCSSITVVGLPLLQASAVGACCQPVRSSMSGLRSMGEGSC